MMFDLAILSVGFSEQGALIDLAILFNVCDINIHNPTLYPDDNLAGSASPYCGY
jgi:hypothetical protein